MKIALLQCDIIWENPAANLDALKAEFAEIAQQGAKLVVLPEMFATGFSMQAEQIAQTHDQSIVAFLLAQAKLHQFAIVGSLALRSDSGEVANTLLFVQPDATISSYAKTHPFSFAGEDQHYTAGNSLLSVHYGGVRFTCFICYDLRFADCFWQSANETDCYLVIANWPKPRREHWRALLQARAIENLAYVVGVNRVGGDGNGLQYAGDSVVVDPSGKRLVEAQDQPEALFCELSADNVAQARRSFPALQDRRKITAHQIDPQKN